MESSLILVVDADPRHRRALSRDLQQAGYAVRECSTGREGLDALDSVSPAAVCLDLPLPDADGLALVGRIQARVPDLPVLVWTEGSSVDHAVAAVRAGVYDYLVKPLDRTRLLTVLRNAVESHRISRRLHRLESGLWASSVPGMLGDSQPMQALAWEMHRVAPSHINVLVRGETGSGKEVVAQALHKLSHRREGPFVALNCAAMPESLLDSELFGHERAAFTGAAARHPGRFEQAHGGTLFLDEVAELSPTIQARLLRVLQERTFYRVGGTQEVHADFRLVAASHRDLVELVRRGQFREDLFFRIAVYELQVPPLRDRGDDVLQLARRFIGLHPRSPGRPPPTLTPEACDVLRQRSWPGNVRELQNAVHRALVLCDGPLLDAQHLAPPAARPLPDVKAPVPVARPEPASRWPGMPLFAPADAPPVPPPVATPNQSEATPVAAPDARGVPNLPLHELERRAILASYARTGGRIAAMLQELQIGRSTLYRKLASYGIQPAGR